MLKVSILWAWARLNLSDCFSCTKKSLPIGLCHAPWETSWLWRFWIAADAENQHFHLLRAFI